MLQKLFAHWDEDGALAVEDDAAAERFFLFCVFAVSEGIGLAVDAATDVDAKHGVARVRGILHAAEAVAVANSAAHSLGQRFAERSVLAAPVDAVGVKHAVLNKLAALAYPAVRQFEHVVEVAEKTGPDTDAGRLAVDAFVVVADHVIHFGEQGGIDFQALNRQVQLAVCAERTGFCSVAANGVVVHQIAKADHLPDLILFRRIL